MKFFQLAFILPALILAGGTAAAADKADLKSEEALMDADRAFAESTARDRLDGWMHFFADDAVKFTFKGPLARGKEAVRAVDAPTFENPAVSLVWEPTDAGLFADGNTGFTRGDYRVLVKDDTGKAQVASSGNYLTMWRLDGKDWKVILDTGQPDPQPDDEAAAHSEPDSGDH